MRNRFRNFNEGTAETPEDRRSFVLDGKRWAEFLKLLNRPPRIKRKLARLLAERSVLE
ncbi:DUF1778 domain-containing protein [Candidatus Binatus sp.]|uniref:type II toxin -antitoxin system TacA 1-like antitoxin n=1 Tax=Candidatus Binatus sp. TaxID=2811406 RepID=UPI003C75208C